MKRTLCLWAALLVAASAALAQQAADGRDPFANDPKPATAPADASTPDASSRKRSTPDTPAPDASAPDTAPADTTESADQMLSDMLRPDGQTPVRPLQPLRQPPATGPAAAAGPDAAPAPVMREGSFIVDRVGRMTKSTDGAGWQFSFVADGQAMQDPPVVLIPNLKLMLMEDQLKATNRDLKFRVTGQVTEYRGQNYVMVEKVVVLQD